MKTFSRILFSLVAFLLLTAVGARALAASDSGLDARIRILQDAFSRFEKERVELQAGLRTEIRARKEAEAARDKALQHVTDLQDQKAAEQLRLDEATRIIGELQAARTEAAETAREQARTMRRLETETERLRAVSESLERANQKLKDRLAVLESAPAPVAERAPAPSEAIRTPDVPEPERADSLPDEVPPPVKANLEEPSLGTAQKMIEQGQVEAAEALLQTLAAVRRPDVKVLTELGRLQLKQKRYPEAIQTFQAALRREPKNVAVLKDLALACHGGNQLAEAIRYLNKVVQLDDKDGESHFNLAALYLMIPSPKIKESAAHYEKALRLGESRDEKLEKVLFQ